MKAKLHFILVILLVFLAPLLGFSQAPNLGTTSNFVLFSSVGAVTNTGISHLTGHVGTNSGSSIGFGNVDGVMHDGDGTTAQATADLITAYNFLNNAIPNYFPAPLLGNGQLLTAGIYSIPSASTLNLDLTLDGQGDPSALFIFKIEGAFASAANAEIKLVNGAQACNVFWKIEGLVDLATGTIMKGTIVANNAAIIMNTGTSLEGRALSTSGAISVDGVLGYTPIGCGSLVLNGPNSPNLNSVECYTVFSSNGAVTNAGVSLITGDVGTNVGLTTGFAALDVTGSIHPIPDGSTAQAAADLLTAYNTVNLIPLDIELLYPAQFGHNLVLTPHTYLLNAATVLTDSIYLNAQNNANAVFLIKINGALTTSTYAKVLLINGAQAKNVFWQIEGAVLISNYSEFKGTIICNNGAVELTSGVQLIGRALTTSGAMSTAAISAQLPVSCGFMSNTTQEAVQQIAVFYPNPFRNSITLQLTNTALTNLDLQLYDVFGRMVYSTAIASDEVLLNLSNLAAGCYFYTITNGDNSIQSGKLIAE